MDNLQAGLSIMNAQLCFHSNLFLTPVTHVGENKSECSAMQALSAYGLSPVSPVLFLYGMKNKQTNKQKQVAEPHFFWASLPKLNPKHIYI